tara:strand:+ start:1244 stop:1411 length:168 start_codon:yes stop_codon:yes gene_type:complete
MRGEIRTFEEDIPNNLTVEQEKSLIALQEKAGAFDVKIVERKGDRFLQYKLKTLS